MANPANSLPPSPEVITPSGKPSPSRHKRIQIRQTFTALQYRNYRLWFTGQLVSLVGTWMQSTAQGYLIYELTRSPAYLGYVGFAAGLPTWLFMLYGGVIADRISRRTLLVMTQSIMMVLALILATITFLGVVQPWHIIILAFLLGTANAFDAPARLAFVPELVPREDLTNAIALNGTMFNLATVFGPAVAGITYAFFGPAWCFMINGLSFIAVIIALILMKLPPWVTPPSRMSTLQNITTGIRYVFREPVVRILILGVGIISLFGLGFVTLMPAWAVEILDGNSATTGLLHSARGVGALIGALTIASLGRIKYRGKLLTIGSLVFPVFLMIFAFMRWLPLSLLALIGAGWGFMVYNNLSNSLVQTTVPDQVRGRVMSVYSMSFFGLMPIGALLAGKLADLVGEPATVMVGATILFLFAILAWVRLPNLRKLE